MEPAWKPGTDPGVDGSTTGRGTAPPFRILGPLELHGDAGPVDLRGARPRRLLARLLLAPGQIVSADRLIAALWDELPPASAQVTLRSHVARVRRALAADGIAASVVTRSPGYLLQLTPGQVDAQVFERDVASGRAALAEGEVATAAATLRAALELWRGPLLQDLGPPPYAEAESARLEELRLTALEARFDADLALGRHRELVGELEMLVDAHPFRERFYGQLMLALVRSDRQAASLEVYQLARQRLRDELGLEPGPALTELEAAILRQDRALHSPPGPSTSRAPVPATELPARSPPVTLFEVVRRQPMVGREVELDRLRVLWRAVADGGARIALLSGEAGVGKTRLVAEVAAEAAAEGATVVLGHCDQVAPIPYAPITDALAASTAVTAAFERLPPAFQHLLTSLVQRPVIPVDDVPVPQDPQERQAAFLAALRSLVAEVTERAPTLLVIEDAEGLDPASTRLLRHLARHLPQRLLLLLCFRDPPGRRHAPLRGLLADLERSGVADRLELVALSEGQLAELVAAWVGTATSPELVHNLWTSTGGNPFFASAVVQELLAQDGLETAGATWSVPSNVRDVLQERLRGLTPEAQEVVGCAAVLGRDAELGLLVQVTGRPEAEVLDALEEAIAAGWLVSSGPDWAVAHTFRHPLMRDAVHADLPALQRQTLHLRAARALERAGLERPSDLTAAAIHLRSSGRLGDREHAASLSLAAADAAAELHAWDETVTHAEAAVAILANADAPAALQAEAARHTAELLTASTTDLPRAISHFRAALDHARRAGDDLAAATVRSRLGFVLAMHHSVMDIPRALEHLTAAANLLTEGEAAFHVQYGTALATVFGVETERGNTAATEAIRLGEELGRPDLVARVRPLEAHHRSSAGELAVAHSLLDDAWLVTAGGDDPRLAWDVATEGALIATVYLLDPATSRTWCDRALARPRFANLPLPMEGITDQLAHALAVLGDLTGAREHAAELPDDAVSRRLLLLLDGEWERAEHSWSAAVERDLVHGDVLNAAMNLSWAAEARCLLGRTEDALDALDHALQLYLDGPHIPGELLVRATSARVLAAGGRLPEAATHLARCGDILAVGGDWRGRAGHVELARAELAAAQGRPADADAGYGQAVATFSSYGLPWWQAETLSVWSQQLAARGQHKRADRTHAAAGRLYDQLGADSRWRRPPAAV